MRVTCPDLRFRHGRCAGMVELVVLGDDGHEFIYPMQTALYEDKPALYAYCETVIKRHARIG